MKLKLLLATLLATLGAVPAHAATRNWDGDTSVTWGDLNNWDTLPTDDFADIAQFNSAAYSFQPSVAAAARSIGGLIIGASSGAVTITAGTTGTGLNIGGSGIDMSTATSNLTLGAGTTQRFTIGAPQTWTVNTGRTLTVAGLAQINNALELTGPGTFAFDTGSTGTGTVTITSGTVRLTTTTSRLGTGAMIINGGTINSSAGGADWTLSNSSYAFNGNFATAGGGSGKNHSFGSGAVTLGGGVGITRTMDVGGSITLIAGPIGDGGNGNAFTKTGSAALVLTAANTYTGTTTVNGGTLHLGGSLSAGSIGGQTSTGSLSALSSIVLTSGTLQFNRNNAVTQGTDFSGSAITGTGGVTQNGGASSVLTLNTANTYFGGTRVNSGTMSVVGAGSLANSSLLSVSTGARFNYLPTTIGTSLTLGAASTLNFAAGSTIGLDWDATTSNKISALGAATVGTGAGVTLALNGAFTPGTTYTVLEAGSGLGTGSYNFLNSTSNHTFAVVKSATSVTVTPTAAAALTSEFWKGGYAGGAGVWAISDGSTSSNWASDLAGTNTSLTPGATATVTFSATGATNQGAMTLGTNMSVAGIVVSDTAAIGLSADGNTLAIGAGGITVNGGAGAVTLAAPISLNAAQVWTNDSLNLLTASGTITNAANTLTVNGTGNTSISGIIGGGAGGLTKSGDGTLTVSGANNYTGATSVSAGTLRVSNAATFANTSAVNLSGTGRLDVNVANQSLAKLSTGGGGTGVVAGTFLRYSTAQTSAGASNGPGTIFGTVELNLTNVNPNYTLDFGAGSTLTNLVTSTFTSSITLSGNATIDSSTAVATYSTGTITSSSGSNTLTIGGSNSGANAISRIISNGGGTLGVTKAGTGSWTLSGANTFTGGLQIKNGTLSAITSTSALGGTGTGAVTLGDSSGTATATLHGDTRTFANAITVQANAAANTNTLGNSGSTSTVFSGLITLNDDLTVASGGTGTVNLSGAATGASLTGAGNVTTTAFTPAATNVTIGGNNVGFSGNVTVGSGSLKMGSATSLSSANTVAVTNVAGAVFDLNNFTETIAGLNSVAGAGTGNVTNTGASDRILTLGGSGIYIYSGTISPTTTSRIALTKSGSGTQTLLNSSTYTGATMVTGGTLLVGDTVGSTASLASGSTVSVGINGTLGGHGTIGGNTTITDGNLSAGASAGSLEFGGNLSLVASAGAPETNVELGGTAFTLNTTEEYDRIKLTGASAVLTLAGTLDVALINSFTLAASQAFGIFQLAPGATRLGTFSGLASDGSLVGNFGGQDLFITYSADFGDSGAIALDGGNDVALYTIVPEPNTWSMLVCGIGLLIMSQRGRRPLKA